MLVLARKEGESVVINENIKIKVVQIDRGKVRIGIDAPREMPVFREELLPVRRKEERGES